MEKTEVHITEEVKLKNPVLIEGLPGLGWVGKLACEHLVDELKAKKFAELYSPDFPPQVMIQKDSSIKMMKADFYYWKNDKKSKDAKDLIILVGDHQGMTIQSHYSISGIILDTVENYGTRMIYTLGGFGTGHMVKKPKVFGAVTDLDLKREFKKHDVIFEKIGGGIVGAAGLLLGLGKLKGMKGICLMGETHGNYVDPMAARNVLDVVCKSIGVKIDMKDLEKKAKQASEMLSKFEQMQKTTAQPPVPSPDSEEPLAYIR